MLKYAKKIVIAVLAVLGAIFILLMLLPDDEEDAAGSEEYVEELQSDIDADNDENEHKEEESVVAEDTSESIASDEIQTNTDVDPVNVGTCRHRLVKLLRIPDRALIHGFRLRSVDTLDCVRVHRVQSETTEVGSLAERMRLYHVAAVPMHMLVLLPGSPGAHVRML